MKAYPQQACIVLNEDSFRFWVICASWVLADIMIKSSCCFWKCDTLSIHVFIDRLPQVIADLYKSAISLLFYLWKFKDTDAMISWLVSAYLTSGFSLKFHLWFLVSSALMRCFCVPGVKCSRLWDPNIWIGVQTTYWQGAIFQKTFFWRWFPM